MITFSKTSAARAAALTSLGLLLAGCSPAEEPTETPSAMSTQQTTDDGVPVPAPEVLPDHIPAPGAAVDALGSSAEQTNDPQSCRLDLSTKPNAIDCGFGSATFDIKTVDRQIGDSDWTIDSTDMIEYDGKDLWTVILSGTNEEGTDLLCTASNADAVTQVSCSTPAN